MHNHEVVASKNLITLIDLSSFAQVVQNGNYIMDTRVGERVVVAVITAHDVRPVKTYTRLKVLCACVTVKLSAVIHRVKWFKCGETAIIVKP